MAGMLFVLVLREDSVSHLDHVDFDDGEMQTCSQASPPSCSLVEEHLLRVHEIVIAGVDLIVQYPIQGESYAHPRHRGLSTRRKIISPRAIGEEQLLVVSERIHQQTCDLNLYKLRRSVFYRVLALLPEEVNVKQILDLGKSDVPPKKLRELLEQEAMRWYVRIPHSSMQALHEEGNLVQTELVGIKRDLRDELQVKLENFTPLDRWPGNEREGKDKLDGEEREEDLADADERLPSLPLDVQELTGEINVSGWRGTSVLLIPHSWLWRPLLEGRKRRLKVSILSTASSRSGCGGTSQSTTAHRSLTRRR
eukprot:767253-Hanusia_phi.AAC.5